MVYQDRTTQQPLEGGQTFEELKRTKTESKHLFCKQISVKSRIFGPDQILDMCILALPNKRVHLVVAVKAAGFRKRISISKIRADGIRSCYVTSSERKFSSQKVLIINILLCLLCVAYDYALMKTSLGSAHTILGDMWRGNMKQAHTL